MSKAMFIHAPFDARVSPFNLPEGKPGEVMIDVAAVGICGSDLHYYKDGRIGSGQVIRQPFIPGHEFAGYLCDDCEDLGLKRGALVAVDPNKSCGVCPWCEQGFHNLCPKVEFIGAPPFNGAMTRALHVPKEQIIPLPEGFTAHEGVMAEPLGIAIHAVDLARPKLLKRVALVGCGPVGLLILQVLRLAGAGDILAVDPQPHRRALAEKLGAAKVGGSVADIAAWTNGEGCPLVIEATNSPDGFRDAVAASRIGGRVILVGIPDGDIYTLGAAEARRRALTIKFSRRMGHVYPRAIEMIASRRIDVNALISHVISLEEAPATFAALAKDAPGYIKVMIEPGR